MALAGKTIAFTGEMVGMTRKEATAIAMAAGATVGSATSKNVQFLFAGHGATPAKTMKAQQNGVNVLAAPQFNQWTQGIKAPVAPVAVPMMAAPAIQYPAYAAPQAFAAPAQTYAAPAPVMVQPTFTNQAVALPGQTVAFTGTLETAAREEAAAMAAQAGAHVGSQVTPTTSFLVVGATPGQSKLNAAQTMGVRNISEEQFMKAALPAVNAMPEVAAPMAYAAPVQTYAAPAVQAYAAPMVRAPRAKKVAAVQAPSAFASPNQMAAMSQAPAQTYAAAPVAPVVQAPMTYEAPMGSMPWETEMVGAAPVQTYAAPVQTYAAPVVRAPRAKKVAFQAPMGAFAAPNQKAAMFQAPAQTYAAPAPIAVAPVAAAPMAQTGAVQLAGQNVVFTGALQVNRVVAATMATKAGAMCGSALGPNTTLLICGANAGPKLAKAQSMGVRCISEAEFVGACRF